MRLSTGCGSLQFFAHVHLFKLAYNNAQVPKCNWAARVALRHLASLMTSSLYICRMHRGNEAQLNYSCVAAIWHCRAAILQIIMQALKECCQQSSHATAGLVCSSW